MVSKLLLLVFIWIESITSEPAPPTEPGCWVFNADCPNQDFDPAGQWYHDTWGEKNKEAAESDAKCAERRHDFNVWCGSTTFIYEWNPPPDPILPGCWMLNGDCPAQDNFDPNGVWYHDTWGEQNKEAAESDEKCEIRRNDFNVWCGSTTFDYHWNPPPKPTEPGCWVLNGDCPNQPNFDPNGEWYHDVWGETNAEAAESDENCAKRKNDFNTWCGSSTFQYHWNPPVTPTTPGCWMFNGNCPNQPNFDPDGKWFQDVWGEENKEAAESDIRCAMRRNDYNSWCGVSTFKYNWVPPPPPSDPGCWVYNGDCPNQAFDPDGEWHHDVWGEENKEAAESDAKCAVRKDDFNNWCGSTTFMYNWNIPDPPQEPGCWIYNGDCPNPDRDFDPDGAWFRDTWGEENKEAAESDAKCAIRRDDFNSWCASTTFSYQWNPPLAPRRPGCWVLNGDCPNQSFDPNGLWYHDTWGEENKGAAESPSKCAVRRDDFNGWCGSSTFRWHWNPPAPPVDPGCYVYNADCPNQDFDPKGQWHHDTWGEENKEASESEAKCAIRRTDFNDWCGSTTFIYEWNPPVPPIEPGCWMLNGDCPNQDFDPNGQWFRDVWGEENKDAALNDQNCAARRQDYNNWCGSCTFQYKFNPGGISGAHIKPRSDIYSYAPSFNKRAEFDFSSFSWIEIIVAIVLILSLSFNLRALCKRGERQKVDYRTVSMNSNTDSEMQSINAVSDNI